MIKFLKLLFKTRYYIVEYKNFQGEWVQRGKYKTYHEALARWRQHYLHCPYLVCRINRI